MSPVFSRVLSFVILGAALVLAGHTLRSALQQESVEPTAALAFLTDRAELTVRTNALVGTYATGDQPGDRTITILADGHVRFAELGATDPAANNSDTYRIAKIGAKFVAATAASGVIEIFDTDTLIYYRDSYRRK